jgi:hypothetical protein
MRKEIRIKFIEHFLSILIVTSLLLAVLFYIQSENEHREIKLKGESESLLNLPFVNFDQPFDKALLKDLLDLYEPDRQAKHDSIIAVIEQYRQSKLLANIESAYRKESLTMNKFTKLGIMYIKFILVYFIVMIVTYYGVQTFGVLRFARWKQKKISALLNFIMRLKTKPEAKNWLQVIKYYVTTIYFLIKALGKAVIYFLLFSPAYVIAYSVKTEINTDSILFMIFLGVISNGLLIMYTNKFFAFLVAESRKGYVQIAIVKNLNASFDENSKSGISLRSIIKFKKRFKGHILDHIYMNARYQYISTVKEQAAFLVTGLIIIEMALNIQGYFSYELLKQLLYKNYDIVIVIILGIFYVVKGTEILIDYFKNREMMKFENTVLE